MSNSIGSNMLLIKSSWNEGETFRMLPLSKDCPYVECIFDPSTKVFVIISSINKTTLHKLPKLDENGDPIPCKSKRPSGIPYKEERKTIETFQEFYVEDLNAIESIINLFAINAKDFYYKKYMDAEVSK